MLGPAGAAGLADQDDPRRRAVRARQRHRPRCRARCSNRSDSRSGRSFIVENRPGGGTTIGSAQVKAAEPDGHTILVHSNAIVTVPAIQVNVPYDPVKDFSGLTPLGNVPLVLVVAPSKGIKTLKELVDQGQGQAGRDQLRRGRHRHAAASGDGALSPGRGLQGQLVPFKGAPEALTEMMTGRVDMYFARSRRRCR